MKSRFLLRVKGNNKNAGFIFLWCYYFIVFGNLYYLLSRDRGASCSFLVANFLLVQIASPTINTIEIVVRLVITERNKIRFNIVMAGCIQIAQRHKLLEQHCIALQRCIEIVPRNEFEIVAVNRILSDKFLQ